MSLDAHEIDSGLSYEGPPTKAGLTPDQIDVLRQGGSIYGKNAAEWGVGMRFNAGKAPVWRGFINYFPRAIEAVSRVSAFGANKYAWNNWQNIDDYYDNITDSLSRHLVNEAKGRALDVDSELEEAAHLAWNAMARLELIVKDRENGSD